LNIFKKIKEKITGEDVERAVWRSLAESEIDLMPEDMAKEYAEHLKNQREID